MSSLRRTRDILVDERLAGTVRDAAHRARDRVSEGMPGVGGDITRWIAALTSGAPPERYFLHPEAFPIFFFPWELEKSLRGRVDQAHQAAISYAGINLYYFVRMIDDVMDGDETVKVHLLPALGHFYHEAERVLARLFPATHPFWNAYGRHWRTGAVAAIRDAAQEATDEQTYRETGGRKVEASKIGLAAVAHLAGRPEVPPAWERVHELFGYWHQMKNDLVDWARDRDKGHRTWLLAEGERRARSGEPLEAWMAREGFSWGLAVMEHWMKELHSIVPSLGSPAVERYLGERVARLDAWAASIQPGLRSIARLFELGR